MDRHFFCTIVQIAPEYYQVNLYQSTGAMTEPHFRKKMGTVQQGFKSLAAAQDHARRLTYDTVTE